MNFGTRLNRIFQSILAYRGSSIAVSLVEARNPAIATSFIFRPSFMCSEPGLFGTLCRAFSLTTLPRKLCIKNSCNGRVQDFFRNSGTQRSYGI